MRFPAMRFPIPEPHVCTREEGEPDMVTEQAGTGSRARMNRMALKDLCHEHASSPLSVRTAGMGQGAPCSEEGWGWGPNPGLRTRTITL